MWYRIKFALLTSLEIPWWASVQSLTIQQYAEQQCVCSMLNQQLRYSSYTDCMMPGILRLSIQLQCFSKTCSQLISPIGPTLFRFFLKSIFSPLKSYNFQINRFQSIILILQSWSVTIDKKTTASSFINFWKCKIYFFDSKMVKQNDRRVQNTVIEEMEM